MFEINSQKIDFEKENLLVKRNINLDVNLDCFILVSTDDKNFWDLIINNILDYIIDFDNCFQNIFQDLHKPMIQMHH